jgi:hypothetical protein
MGVRTGNVHGHRNVTRDVILHELGIRRDYSSNTTPSFPEFPSSSSSS